MAQVSKCGVFGICLTPGTHNLQRMPLSRSPLFLEPWMKLAMQSTGRFDHVIIVNNKAGESFLNFFFFSVFISAVKL